MHSVLYNKRRKEKEKRSCDICKRKRKLKHQEPTFAADPDSSKLERNPWVRNGLNFSGPVVSIVHASQSLDETSEIEGTTEIDTFLGFIP